MNKRLRFAIVAASLIILGSCAAKKAVVLSQTDAERAATKFPGATLASLNEGKQHYENNCGTCHGLKSPTSESEAEWRNIVPDMAQKAKVDSKTEDLILQYVITMSMASATK
jgi:cytochrome c5